jgi:hypothetical protein
MSSRWFRILPLTLLGQACDFPPEVAEDPPPDPDTETQELTNAPAVNANSPRFNNMVRVNRDGSFCSGTMLSRRWVMTARHCIGNTGPVSVQRQGVAAITATSRFANPDVDTTLLRLGSDFPDISPMRIWPGSNAELQGMRPEVYGVGPSGVEPPTVGTFRITSVNQPNGYRAPNPTQEQPSPGATVVGGDSGGGHVVNVGDLDYLIGHTSAVESHPEGTMVTSVSAPHFFYWMTNTLFNSPTNLGGSQLSGPALTRGGGSGIRYSAFGLRSDGRIYINRKSSSGWSGWNTSISTPSGGLNEDLTAVTRPNNDIWLFGRGTGNSILARRRNASSGSWESWVNLGGSCTAGAGAAARGNGDIEVFCRGQDGRVYQQTGPTWTGWNRSIAPPSVGLAANAPSAVFARRGFVEMLHLVARGADNRVYYQKWTEQNGWLGWENLGANTPFAPAVSSYGNERIDFFSIGTGGQLYHLSFDGRGPAHTWALIRSSLTTSGRPAAYADSARAPQFEVVGRRSDGSFWNQTYAY